MKLEKQGGGATGMEEEGGGQNYQEGEIRSQKGEGMTNIVLLCLG